jgi:hypothetical protein
MIYYLLGIITGIMISTINIVLFERFKIPIQRNIMKADRITHDFFTGNSEKGYVAGMSEEESNYMQAITKDKPLEL